MRISGSPPHARGRHQLRHSFATYLRITPACAGKTAPTIRGAAVCRDHPRMRGEDTGQACPCGGVVGSPPHARGRRDAIYYSDPITGITPACAGKTGVEVIPNVVRKDHPRMRGEDSPAGFAKSLGNGSPPHARGRHGVGLPAGVVVGITPACAGKTRIPASAPPRRTHHPRMRGEDSLKMISPQAVEISPPHARGRLECRVCFRQVLGITPACAGKTQRFKPLHDAGPDHPRMRGEDKSGVAPVGKGRGSPPHARGRLGFHCTQTTSSGITPACAGKTARRTVASTSPTDHPRMRGEDRLSWATYCSGRGSPPHARGRLFHDECGLRADGITPACAGKTPLPRNRCQPRKDHPRMRGEDKGGARKRKQNVGSPPHARGRLDRDVDQDVHGSDHPRMRGEDEFCLVA